MTHDSKTVPVNVNKASIGTETPRDDLLSTVFAETLIRQKASSAAFLANLKHQRVV